MSKVKTTIKPDLTSKVEVEGVSGEGCRTASGPATKALGGKVTSDNVTPEMSQVPAAQAAPVTGSR